MTIPMDCPPRVIIEQPAHASNVPGTPSPAWMSLISIHVPGEAGGTWAGFNPQAWIRDFPNEPYVVSRAIPVTVAFTGDGFLASWGDANIAMTGDSESAALSELAADILDTYETYDAEADTLGPGPARQLALIKTYIAKR